MVDVVLPIELGDVARLRRLLDTPSLQARDAIHVAIMPRHEIGHVLSVDRALDQVTGIMRVNCTDAQSILTYVTDQTRTRPSAAAAASNRPSCENERP